MKLFVDMDGVLSDFILGCKRLLNFTDPWPVGEYDLAVALGKNPWPEINEAGVDFWANLPKTKEADEIMDIAMKRDYYILSACAYDPCIPHGKLLWLKKHYPRVVSKQRWIFTTHKHLLASGNTLIDDYDVNIENWSANGGIGILLPRPWNTAHAEPEPIWAVRSLPGVTL